MFPKTPFEWEFLNSDAVVVQAGSSETPREGTIRGAVRAYLPVCSGKDMTWTYRLSADYNYGVGDSELELRFKASTAPGVDSETACKQLSW